MNYVLLFIRGEVGADKKGGDGGIYGGDGVGRRAIEDQRNNLKRFMIHGDMKASGAELAAKKAASNRGRGRRI